jgi:hypothetical protein
MSKDRLKAEREALQERLKAERNELLRLRGLLAKQQMREKAPTEDVPVPVIATPDK